tara:strand:- start:2101 stop:2556 length:456 start_codon:yes stop_codon:yes gene_type:complete
MSFLLGNKLVGIYVFTNATAVVKTVTFAITGFSHSGGDRPEIDITTAASSRRQVLAGLASPEEMTLSVKYQVDDVSDPTTDDGVDLREALVICASGSLTIKMNNSDACGTARTYLETSEQTYTALVDAVSWNFSTELDGIMEGEVTFRVRH